MGRRRVYEGPDDPRTGDVECGEDDCDLEAPKETPEPEPEPAPVPVAKFKRMISDARRDALRKAREAKALKNKSAKKAPRGPTLVEIREPIHDFVIF